MSACEPAAEAVLVKGAQADHAGHLVADLRGDVSEPGPSLLTDSALTSNSVQHTPHSSPTNGPGGSVKTAQQGRSDFVIRWKAKWIRTEVATGCNRTSAALKAVADVHFLLRLVAYPAQTGPAHRTLDEVARIGRCRLAGRDGPERGRGREKGLRREERGRADAGRKREGGVAVVAGAVALEGAGQPWQLGFDERAWLDRDGVRVQLVVVARAGGADDEAAAAAVMLAIEEAERLAASATLVCRLIRLPNRAEGALLESRQDVRANACGRLVCRYAKVGGELRRKDGMRRGDGGGRSGGAKGIEVLVARYRGAI